MPPQLEPGELFFEMETKSLLVGCGTNSSMLKILRMKIAGKAECDAKEWWQGTGKKFNEECLKKTGKRLSFV